MGLENKQEHNSTRVDLTERIKMNTFSEVVLGSAICAAFVWAFVAILTVLVG